MDHSNHRNIIVIGASAGGFEAIKCLVSNLPRDLAAAVFIVWHMSPDVFGILPQVLNRLEVLPATAAVDGEPIRMGHIYTAPPDRHLLIEKDRVRVTHGPKENRFRPAIDPLFRSAAYAYGSQVIGVVLTGALDDGSAGLWAIKQHGGLAIVQDPADAEMPSMPENALRTVKVDHKVPVAVMGALLARLIAAPITLKTVPAMREDEKNKREINIAMQGENTSGENLVQYLKDFGQLTPYTCPECHGVLSMLRDGDLMRFRCHTGHAFSTDSLLATLTENIEANLWGAIRSIQESIILLNHMGDHLAEANQPQLAATYFKKAREAEERAQLVRKTVHDHEQLSSDGIEQQTGQTGSGLN